MVHHIWCYFRMKTLTFLLKKYTYISGIVWISQVDKTISILAMNIQFSKAETIVKMQLIFYLKFYEVIIYYIEKGKNFFDNVTLF